MQDDSEKMGKTLANDRKHQYEKILQIMLGLKLNVNVLAHFETVTLQTLQ